MRLLIFETESEKSVEKNDLRECLLYIGEIQECLCAARATVCGLNDVDKSILSIQWPFSERQICPVPLLRSLTPRRFILKRL